SVLARPCRAGDLARGDRRRAADLLDRRPASARRARASLVAARGSARLVQHAPVADRVFRARGDADRGALQTDRPRRARPALDRKQLDPVSRASARRTSLRADVLNGRGSSWVVPALTIGCLMAAAIFFARDRWFMAAGWAGLSLVGL